jgi:xyloglucan-specific exo-beta-1,4-glucanase
MEGLFSGWEARDYALEPDRVKQNGLFPRRVRGKRRKMHISALSRPLLRMLVLSGVFGCGAAGAGAPGASTGATEPGAGGPTSADGTPYVWKNVAIRGGGFVTGVVFSPAKAGVVYARTDVGGAYRFEPEHATWTPLNDSFDRASNFMGIESIAVDPVDANKVYAAVGTYTASWAGNGAMLRSDDRGTTWQQTDVPFKMGANENGRSNGERLVVDPNQPQILFFGSRKNGLWKSVDGSVTWKKVDAFPIKEDADGLGIPFVVFDTKSGSRGKATPTLYAGVSKLGAGLYVSTDAGESWKPVPKQPAGFMPHHAAFDGAGTLYLTYANLPGPSDLTDGAVYKYEPKKQSFTNITPLAPAGEDKFGYAGLAVDAAHPGTLMVTTLDRWAKGDEIFRSTDGGKSYKPLNDKAEWDVAGAQYLFWHRDKLGKPHWVGDIDIDPFAPGHAMFVTGAGLWRSTDANAADTNKATHWTFSCEGLEETVVGALVSPPAGAPLLSGMGDISGFRHDDLDKPPADGMFSDPVGNATTGLDFAANKPEVVARVGTVWGEGKHGARSEDGGKTWRAFPKEPKNGATGGAIAITADASTLVWVIKKEEPVRSLDGGATWQKIEGLPVPEEAPDWVQVALRPAADRVNPKKIYVFDTAEGKTYTSSDGGAHFEGTATNMPGLPDYLRSAGSIRAVPGIEGRVWLSTSKDVFVSKDSGVTYTELGTVDESFAIGFGKAAPGRTHPAAFLIGKVAGKYGFYRSDDAGATWVRLNDDAHQYGFAGVITGDPRVFGRVYVGTGGRGILYGMPQGGK